MANHFSFPPPPPPPSSHRQQSGSNDGKAIGYPHSNVRQRVSDSNSHPCGRSDSSAGRDDAPISTGGAHNQRFHHMPVPWSRQQSSEQHGTNHDAYPRTRHVPQDQTGLRTSSATGFAGHKRKRETMSNQKPAHSRPAGPETAPAVPSFGAAIVKPPVAGTGRDQPTQAVRAPRSSLFGIRQAGSHPDATSDTDSDRDDDEHDDVDEEASFAQLGTKLVFEYEGTVVKLDSEADLARWQADRRQRWPSSLRIAEKQAERQKTGAERRRLLEAAYGLREPGFKFRLPRQWQTQAIVPSNHSSQAEPMDKPDAPKSLKDVSATPISLPGMAGYDSDDQSDAQEESSTVQPSDTPAMRDQLDDQFEDENVDDDAPEVASSKDPQPLSAPSDQRACKYYFYYGKCREGDDCSYRHDAQTDRPVVHVPAMQKRSSAAQARKHKQAQGRKGIHLLLVEQESEAADRLALRVIKYLGGIGFFKEE